MALISGKPTKHSESEEQTDYNFLPPTNEGENMFVEQLGKSKWEIDLTFMEFLLFYFKHYWLLVNNLWPQQLPDNSFLLQYLFKQHAYY